MSGETDTNGFDGRLMAALFGSLTGFIVVMGCDGWYNELLGPAVICAVLATLSFGVTITIVFGWPSSIHHPTHNSTEK